MYSTLCSESGFWRIAATIILSLVLVACDHAATPPPSNNLRLIDNARKSGQPTVVEFGSDSCTSCRRMQVVMATVAHRAEGRAHVLVMDVRKDRRLAESYRVAMIPTQVFFDARGQETWRHPGPLTEDQVLARLEQDQ